MSAKISADHPRRMLLLLRPAHYKHPGDADTEKCDKPTAIRQYNSYTASSIDNIRVYRVSLPILSGCFRTDTGILSVAY